MAATPEDPDLIRRMRLGDEAALETLYARYGGLLYTLALRIVGDRELAREVLQDTLLRAWDGRENYDVVRGRVPWWLMEIAQRQAVIQALAELSGVQRTAIELAYYGGFTQAEIATRLGEHLGTIKSR